jgi:VanZ family protein
VKRLLHHRWLNAWLLPVVLYAVILAGSSVPGENIPKVFQLTPDKLIHFVEYFVFTFFLARALVARTDMKRSHVWAICLAVGWAAAALDEFYQSFVPGRTPDYRDWLIDAAGVWAGVALLLSWWKKSSTK